MPQLSPCMWMFSSIYSFVFLITMVLIFSENLMNNNELNENMNIETKMVWLW